MSNEKPTERQAQVLDWIRGFVRRNFQRPTLDEIADGLGVSKSTIHEHLSELRKKNLVRWEDNKPRTIEVLEES